MSETVDRYQALGIPYPDATVSCLGECEGTGMVPVLHRLNDGIFTRACDQEPDERFLTPWFREHRKCSPLGRFLQFFRFDLAVRYGWETHWSIVTERCNGWHFVKCPDCGGSGKR